MARKATAESFLKKMNLGADAEPGVEQPAAGAAQGPAEPSKTKQSGGRAGLKHIGGYFDRETVEQVAVLRARLDLDNSQLIKRAIEELYSREMAARKFGDR
jgi:hypothetical protein